MATRITFCCTDTASEPWLQGLRAALPGTDVSLWAPGTPPADYAVVWAPPQAFFDEQAQLKAVFNIGAGVDALLKLKLPSQALIVRLDDAGMSVQMAEYVCHAVIRHFREFDAYEADTRQGKWSFRKPRDRADFPVGIMGLGVLGERVARSLAQFEFAVNGWSRSSKAVDGVQCFSGAQGFQDFLAASRVLVCLLPLTPDTRDIINRDSLSSLQTGGYIINVARGAHLVEDDLLALLESGHIAGATLDVFRTEPLPAGHPFWTHPKITVTPHTSARTLRSESIAQIAGKIAALQRGEPVAGVVDRGQGY
ncbi:MAG: glyoxylate/hydroxypyruvate reductase A [Burkholderiaceae bacterium]|nr:glyoxylate/hydroxypyruvate reductase A [Burkholderiaceae bacterium]